MKSDTRDHIQEKRYDQLKQTLDEWMKCCILIVITGSVGVGKSSFINNMLGLPDEDCRNAETGIGDTTQKPKLYSDPCNGKMLFLDVPGFGSLTNECDEKYLKEIHAAEADFFLIFYGTTISKKEIWLIEKLQEMKKKFALVRTRADDFKNMKKKSVEEWINEAKTKCHNDLQKNNIANVKVFIISNIDPDIGEFHNLFTFMGESMSDVQRSAILHYTKVFTDEIIEGKKKQLLSRTWLIAGAMTLNSSFPLPLLKMIVHDPLLKKEVQLYRETFGLEDDVLEHIPKESIEKLDISMSPHVKGIASAFRLIGMVSTATALILGPPSVVFLDGLIEPVVTVTQYVVYVKDLRGIVKQLAAVAKRARNRHLNHLINE
ncbi:hypothetical protein FSP39_003758 [Pinctada imbricata]|uniref:IRG-type G domain-containing protein n=1 Tax=Pinctada imbricata TaxID=66713 RepID=A0AA89BVC6_PINIB|nr:hypothetical protein FSP39_003758 [Pinctada imbricata]